MIAVCDFHDLKSVGDRFSWTGKRYTHDVWCCLDRSMANSEWLAMYPSAQTEFLPFEDSDHRPLVTSLAGPIAHTRGNFIYDKRLYQNDGFRETVLNSWNNIGGSASLNTRICKVRKSMSAWKRQNRPHAAECTKLLKHQLDQALSNPGYSTQNVADIHVALSQAYRDEEQFWRLKSRNDWVLFGDRNTKFFYASAKTRKTICRFLMEKGLMKEADVLFRKMKEDGPSPDDQTYNTLIRAHHRDGDTAASAELDKEMRNCRFAGDASNISLVTNMLYDGRLDRKAFSTCFLETVYSREKQPSFLQSICEVNIMLLF